jgi:hypothetical protein
MSTKLQNAGYALYLFYRFIPVEQRQPFREIEKSLSTRNANKSFEDFVNIVKPQHFNMRPDRQEAALEALIALCELADDRPIEAPTAIKTFFQFSYNQLNELKKSVGCITPKKKSPFNFIGGICYDLEIINKQYSREIACEILLKGLDEPVFPELGIC